MKKLIFLFLTVFLISSVNAQKKLTADLSQTKLTWHGEKVLGKHDGTIQLKAGWIQWQDNKITAGEFIIDMASLEESEDNQKFEGHLKSDDFFGVEKFPTSKLVLTGSTAFDKGTATVIGNLTIKDVTNPIEFKSVMQQKDDGMWFFSNITIDRTKYNIRYGSGTFFDNLGDKTIYDEFNVKVNLFVK